MFAWLKIKLKGCHFETIEVSEAESQAVPSTHTGHRTQESGNGA
jgi:hypothetical protein